jgi:hypothetical protein
MGQSPDGFHSHHADVPYQTVIELAMRPDAIVVTRRESGVPRAAALADASPA